MTAGVTLYCDGMLGIRPCPKTFATKLNRIPYARDAARAEGWTRRQGVELCPGCSAQEYGPHLKGRRTKR